MTEDIINELIDLTKDIKIDDSYYINIYIYSYNVCNPKKYIKNKIYINNTSILVNNNDEIILNTNKIKLHKKNIKKTIKIKNKDKKFKFIFLKKMYNLNDINVKWIDIYNFYTLYDLQTDNFIDIVLKNIDNKKRLKKKIFLEKSNEYITFKYIYLIMNKYFNKIFKK